MIFEVQEWFRLPVEVLQEFLNELSEFKLKWGSIKNKEDLRELSKGLENKNQK